MERNQSLTPWRSFGLSRDPFADMHRQFDQMLQSFWPAGAPAAQLKGFDLSPSIDVHSDDKQVVVTAELPGLSEKDVEVTLQDNVLTIRGEKKAEREEKDEKKNWHVMERSYGSFQRSLPFGVEIDATKVAAKFDKGVLTVTLPKAAPEAAKSTKIQIAS